jgi:hypothetical protein
VVPCAHCGSQILFGGARLFDMRFCNSGCRGRFLAAKEALNAQTSTTDQAHLSYRAALDQLRKAPEDPALRQRALEAGRSYAALVRDGSATTVFDEVAVSNDIEIACATAATARSGRAPRGSPASDREV